jgi:hypothetical protein
MVITWSAAENPPIDQFATRLAHPAACPNPSVVLLSSMLWRTFYSESPNPIFVSVASRGAILTDNTKAVVSRLDWGLQSQTANYVQPMRCSTPNRRTVLISAIFSTQNLDQPTVLAPEVKQQASQSLQSSLASCVPATKPVRHQPVPRQQDKLLVDGISGRPRRGSTWRVYRCVDLSSVQRGAIWGFCRL